MKRLVPSHGQHFLRSSAFIAELIGHSNIRKNDLVVDLGAGSGAITAVLGRRAARVIAIENEPVAYSKLQQNLGHDPKVTIVHGDMRQVELPKQPYKVFANIPFRLSSQMVRRLTTDGYPPKAVYLIVQRQFAQKLITSGDHFHGALGMMIAPWWQARIRRPLRKTDFTPPPAVDTVLLEITPRLEALLPSEQQASYMQFVEKCFAEPRYYTRVGGSKEFKPSRLTIEEWVVLYSRQAHSFL